MGRERKHPLPEKMLTTTLAVSAIIMAGLLTAPAAILSAPEGNRQPETECVTDTGTEIVKYALQFVGGPYEWGGNSLTEGIDCSGFIHEVYAEFGIDVPRYSKDFLDYGENIGTDISDALPADVVCYEGHVALYIGDGQVVHASNPKPYPSGGIKVSDADYREILSIRRYID